MNDAYAYLAYLQERVGVLFDVRLHVELHFDLKGSRTLGQCRYLSKDRYRIRLHAPLLKRYGEVYLDDVLTHEIAHAVQFSLYANRTKPHGKEWRAIMETLEGKCYRVTKRPKYDTTPYRQKKRHLPRFDYVCQCEGKRHSLTSIRHNRIQNGSRIYRCIRCLSPVYFVNSSDQ